MAKDKPPERKADVFAGKKSLSWNLKKRREAMDMGDPAGKNPSGDITPNEPAQVLKAGYFIEDEKK